MKCETITMAELMKGNKRMCLSAERGLKICYKCKHYDTCESKIINRQYDVLQEKKRRFLDDHNTKLAKINADLENFGK